MSKVSPKEVREIEKLVGDYLLLSQGLIYYPDRERWERAIQQHTLYYLQVGKEVLEEKIKELNEKNTNK